MRMIKGSGTPSNVPPQRALPIPRWARDDAPQATFSDGVAPPICVRKKQQLLLDVGRERGEFHDLRHAGAGHVTQPRKIGVVTDFTTIDHVLELDRECHESGHASERGP